jgi:glycerophosphoryl diester phosphodiesterase
MQSRSLGPIPALPMQVPTVQEYIDVALSANRTIGIYPETKHPSWHNALPILEGTTMEDLLLEVLTANGYKGNVASDTWARQPVFIQSFEVSLCSRLPSCGPQRRHYGA